MLGLLAIVVCISEPPTVMRTANILLVGALAYFGINFLQKGRAAQMLSFIVQRVSFRFSGIVPVIDIVVGIQNPTGQNLNVGSIAGELYLNNAFIANISGFQLTRIKANSVAYFPISARLSISGLIGEGVDIVKAIQQGGFSQIFNQTIMFKGVVNAEGVSLPLNFQYKVL